MNEEKDHKDLEEFRDLLKNKRYSDLREKAAEMNEPDVAAVLEMTSGYFECPRCGTYFVPTKTAYIMGMHTTMRRHLRCPHCGEKSWCRRRLSRKED
mgnify:CR=1 FL=1